MQRRHLGRLAGAAILSPLAGCGGTIDEDSSQQARLRLINASPGYASLDLYDGDTLVSSGVVSGTAGGVHTFDSGSRSLTLTRHGNLTSLTTQNLDLGADTDAALIAYGWEGSIQTVRLAENESAPSSGRCRFQVLNTAASDAPSVDVYLTDSTESLDTATAVAAKVSGTTGGYTTVGSGTYRLRVTTAGSRTDVLLDVSGVSLASEQVQTLLLMPTAGGVLLDALMVVQRGSVTRHAGTQARLRVITSISGGDSGTTVNTSLGGVSLVSGAPLVHPGNYARVAAGSAVLSVSIGGTTPITSNRTLVAGADYTLLIWGSIGAPQIALISEDNRLLPDTTTQPRIRLLHAVTDLSGAMTLAYEYIALNENIAQGQMSAWRSFTAATEKPLVITAPSYSNSVALYTFDKFTPVARGLYTVFMLGSIGALVPRLLQDRQPVTA